MNTHGTLSDNSVSVQESFSEGSLLKEVNIKEVKRNVYDDFFESVWSIYPKKEGKGQVSNNQKQVLYKIGFEELSRAIDRYKKIKSGTDKKYLQMGSTFFNSGYIDYLDKEYKQNSLDSPGRRGVIEDNSILVRRDDY